MSTALKTEEEKKEYFDSDNKLNQKIKQLAQLIKESKHMVAFTGAGVSTACGIPDFRSGINTVLKTGPGAWLIDNTFVILVREVQATNYKNKEKIVSVPFLKAVPSPTHMGLVELEKLGYLKFVISQNVDGLHRRSGFPPEKLAELHGNLNLEICKTCNKQYLRDYDTYSGFSHETGRYCADPKCKGKLFDSIINFGENLPKKDLTDGFKHSELADLCIVFGSSLRVSPANEMPQLVAERKEKLVIINLQRTPLDQAATLQINALCETVMLKLAQEMNFEIPE